MCVGMWKDFYIKQLIVPGKARYVLEIISNFPRRDYTSGNLWIRIPLVSTLIAAPFSISSSAKINIFYMILDNFLDLSPSILILITEGFIFPFTASIVWKSESRVITI